MRKAQGGSGPPPPRRFEAPYNLEYCQMMGDRWLEIYSCERFTREVFKDDFPAFSMPMDIEYEAQLWCLDVASGRWGTYPAKGSKVVFIFEDERDAAFFKLTFSDHPVQQLE